MRNIVEYIDSITNKKRQFGASFLNFTFFKNKNKLIKTFNWEFLKMVKYYCEHCRLLYNCETYCKNCGTLANNKILIEVQRQPNDKE
jgi:hypothetical protein